MTPADKKPYPPTSQDRCYFRPDAMVHHGKDCTGEKKGIERKYGRLREREGERGRGQKKTRETVRDCQKGAV